jgi:hypothetical protein
MAAVSVTFLITAMGASTSWAAPLEFPQFGQADRGAIGAHAMSPVEMNQDLAWTLPDRRL